MLQNKLRSYLPILLCVTSFWLVVILICLSKTGDESHLWLLDEAGSSNVETLKTVPYALRSLRLYHSPLPKKSKQEILFYDLDINKTITLATLSKADHELESRSLNSIRNDEDVLVKNKGDKLFSFNLLVSNRVGPMRNLPDTRPLKCPAVEIDHDKKITTFPRASIIICYYNEAPSALLRTINSLIMRSPHESIEEIIVVDDYSDSEFRFEHIESYIIKSYVEIRATKTMRREGLIRARLHGAKMATGQILIFLDSHVEANTGWLEPLISVVSRNNDTVACPMIDLINAETMIYTASPMVKGGLNWALNFKWDSVPSIKLKTLDDFAEPIDTPTMAGGLYAINREYFYHIGAYDELMELWGGENIEMSLRVWLCGGRIQILPCSRIGHIFRKTRPYGPKPNQPDSLLVNSLRTAKVWLGEFIERYYEHHPHARGLDVGDVKDRVMIRESLKCKNFSWFIENIYPELKETADKSNRSEASPQPVRLFETNRSREIKKGS